MSSYGKELILDLQSCDSTKFTRQHIITFFDQLCEVLDMEPCQHHFWDYQNEPEEYKAAPDHLKGTSAVMFISTSSIVIHTLDVLEEVYLNIFSCKEFDTEEATNFVVTYFGCDKNECTATTKLRGIKRDRSCVTADEPDTSGGEGK